MTHGRDQDDGGKEEGRRGTPGAPWPHDLLVIERILVGNKEEKKPRFRSTDKNDRKPANRNNEKSGVCRASEELPLIHRDSKTPLPPSPEQSRLRTTDDRREAGAKSGTGAKFTGAAEEKESGNKNSIINSKEW